MLFIYQLFGFQTLNGDWIKWESGVNPEQTRCCKFQIKQFVLFATVHIVWEGALDWKQVRIPAKWLFFVIGFRGIELEIILSTLFWAG